MLPAQVHAEAEPAVCDVLKAEPQYYDWMMKGDFPLHTKQKLTEILTRTLLKK